MPAPISLHDNLGFYYQVYWRSCDCDRKRNTLIHIDLFVHICHKINPFGITALKNILCCTLFILGCLSTSLWADDPQNTTEQGLDKQVEELKKAVIELNRELFVLEETLLFPGNTQVSVFLSMDTGTYFKLDSVQLLIDNKERANHLYTKRELKALQRGGVQRLYLGNLKAGEHELVAFFTGAGPQGRDYKRGATVSFKKGIGPKYLELKIIDSVALQQPDFDVREWE
jgi:hypothetical protein